MMLLLNDRGAFVGFSLKGAMVVAKAGR